MSGFITDYLSTTVATVDYHIALFRVGLGADGFHLTAAGIGSVAGVNVHVERPEAKGAMVAGGKAQGEDFLAAMGTEEAVIVFGKSFLFHKDSLKGGDESRANTNIEL